MSADSRCEHYWRDGVLLVERGQADPHRDDCLDCRRAHESRGDLVRALALVGAGAGDPWWQERVWRAIRRERAPKPAAWSWMPWASALAAACVLIAFVSARGLHHRERDEGELARPRIDIVPSEVATRSTSAGIGDRVRISVAAHQEVRIYRGEKLLLRCAAAAAAATTPGCAAAAGGLAAEHVLRLPGEYQLLIVPAGILSSPLLPSEAGSAGGAPAAEPSAASLDRDLQAITSSGSTYQLEVLVVR